VDVRRLRRGLLGVLGRSRARPHLRLPLERLDGGVVQHGASSEAVGHRARGGDRVVSVAGIDVGATLCKLAVQKDGVAVAHYPSTDLFGVRALVEAWGPTRIGVTGGGADRLGMEIGGVLLRHVSEFEAWGRGGAAVATLDGVTLPPKHLMVSL